MYKGTIVENSLAQVGILDKLEVVRRYQADDWVLDDVLIDDALIPELQQSLKAGPWYIHLWPPGADEVKVIYKNKIFDISHSDKSTWADAVAYGTSLGIPAEQLDFPIG